MKTDPNSSSALSRQSQTTADQRLPDSTLQLGAPLKKTPKRPPLPLFKSMAEAVARSKKEQDMFYVNTLCIQRWLGRANHLSGECLSFPGVSLRGFVFGVFDAVGHRVFSQRADITHWPRFQHHA